MKKTVLLVALLYTAMHAFCQEPAAPALTKTDYSRKSRSEKTAAWVLLGGSLAMLAGSAATYQINIDFGPMFGAPSNGSSHADNTASTLLGIGGVGALVASLVSFHAAKHHKKKAAAFTIGNQRIPQLQHKALGLRTQPVIQLRIPL